jgi:hypothetical protein
MKTFLAVGVIAAIFAAGPSWGRTIIDSDWISLNGIAGVSDGVTAIATKGTEVYVAGNFSGAGDIAVRRIAKWDGTRWGRLGSGMDSSVFALAFDKKGNLYAGGSFHTAGGAAASHIAKWDGTQWSPLGSGLNGDVHSLVCDGTGNLYAGGAFTSAGGNEAGSVAKWDGSAWSALGKGITQTEYAHSGALTIKALAVGNDGMLYAAGLFDTAGGIPAHNIARWNGSAWDSLGPGLLGGIPCVYALTLDHSGNLYAAGSIFIIGGIGGQRVSGIAKWNGLSWSGLDSGVVGGNSVVATALACDKDGTIVVGGNFTWAGDYSCPGFAKWNGTEWEKTVNPPPDPGVMAFDSGGNLYCSCGPTQDSAGGYATGIVKWNGSTIYAMGKGITGDVSHIAFDPQGNPFITGSFTSGKNGTFGPAYTVARRRGAGWDSLGVRLGINCLVNDGHGALYADAQASTYTSSWYVLKGDDVKWNIMGTFGGGYVNAICFGAQGRMYVGGEFTTINNMMVNGIAQWDGATWSALGAGIREIVYWNSVSGSGIRIEAGSIQAQVIDRSGNLFVAGNFDTAGEVPVKNIAKWDGTSWSACATGIMERNTGIVALAADDSGNIYAAGEFDISGGINKQNVVKWDGIAWSRLGPGMNDRIISIAVDGKGTCYAAGWFTTAGGIAARHIAQWNGIEWEPLGSGTDNYVDVLVIRDSTLYVGGDFTLAGDKASPGIAAVNIHSKGRSAVLVQKMPTESAACYRLFNRMLNISHAGPLDRIELFTLRGRRVALAAAAQAINLAGLAPQPLIVRIYRGTKPISAGMLMVQ